MFTLLFEPASLLDEAHEWSDSRPRADHDDWVGGLEGQPELGLANVHGHGGLVTVISNHFVLKPVGGYSLVDAASLGLVLHDHSADVDAVGVNLKKTKNLLIGDTEGPTFYILRCIFYMSFSILCLCHKYFVLP